MNVVIAIGAVLCVPIIIVLTLEVEIRADRWFRKGAALASADRCAPECSCCRRRW